MIQVNTNGATTQDFETITAVIKLETERKVNKVMYASGFGITTACFIDGEFQTVSEYPLDGKMIAKLEKA